MKRLLASLCAVVAAGALASACGLAPPAATVNGSTISTGAFDSQLTALDGTQAGQCLLEAETGRSIRTQGSGGRGTFDMGFADSILQSSVTNTLAFQLAASKGLAITAADLAAAKTDFVSLLGGEIAAAAQQSQTSNTASYCVASTGQALTPTQVLSGLPPKVTSALVHNDAVDERLLAEGSHITAAQISAFFAANRPLFTTACVSVIVTNTKAHATQYLSQIDRGTAFAAVAKAHSLDTRSAGAGGSLGCSFTEAQVIQALGIPSYRVGTPIGPLQDPSTGAWQIYLVTSQSQVTLAASTAEIRYQLLQSATNAKRVAGEILAFARRSHVQVDPQYGSWVKRAIVAPASPPLRDLLAAASGASAKSLAGPSGRAGTRPGSGSAVGSGRAAGSPSRRSAS